MKAPWNPPFAANDFFAFSSTTKESSLNKIPPLGIDNPSKVLLHNLSISPVVLVVGKVGAYGFKFPSFLPVP